MFTGPEDISPENNGSCSPASSRRSGRDADGPASKRFSSVSMAGTNIALPNSKARSPGFGATIQGMHLVLPGTSIRRKCHENAMSSVMGSSSLTHTDYLIASASWLEEHWQFSQPPQTWYRSCLGMRRGCAGSCELSTRIMVHLSWYAGTCGIPG